MKRSSWILLILLIITIGGYFLMKYIAEKKVVDDIATPAVSAYLGQEPDAILMTLRMYDQDYHIVEMQRNQDGFWDITLPAPGTADLTLASEAETQITNLLIVSSIGDVTSLADFGLTFPFYTIKLTYSNGITHVLEVGNLSSIGSGYYIRLDEGEVYVISQYSIDPVVNLISNPPYPATATPVLTIEPAGSTVTPVIPTGTP